MATMSTPTQPEVDDKFGEGIPSLVFDNRTDYEALHFDTIDQYDTAFHVIVVKIGYSLGDCNADGVAQLVELDEPATLNVEDLYNEDSLACSVRQESDLAPYKPFCDVIVNAEAHAPRGKSTRHFNVRLSVQQPDSAAPLPERPHGLNPLQGPRPDQLAAWEQERKRVSNTRIAGAMLIDKSLKVTGERFLCKKMWPIGLLQFGVKLCTLGLAKPNPWRLTSPQPFKHLPLRYEFAHGGQCRVEPDDKAAPRVAKKHRLTPEQIAKHPDNDAPPVAHDACMSNPVGIGFALRWYLDAVRPEQVFAPRIEYPAKPFTVATFLRVAGGKPCPEPAGMGFIGRAWLPRRTLIGHIETKTHWRTDEVPRLPKDFDFRYWNGAPADQQCAHLAGEERFTLTNLCPHDAPFARVDAQGNTVLQFVLPRQALFVLGAENNGQFSTHTLGIDTVMLDLEEGRVDLVWRICLPADGDIDEARLMHISEEAQLQRLKALQTPPAQDETAHVL